MKQLILAENMQIKEKLRVHLSFRISTAVIALVLAFIFAVSPGLNVARAQDAGQPSGSGLQISPTRTDLNGQPGERKTFKVVVRNVTQTDLIAQGFLNDFQSDNVSGTPQIIVDSDQRTPYTLQRMLHGFGDFEIKAGETKEVNLTVDIPPDAAPGAYFGALRYAAIPKGRELSQSERQVALTASVAHLVFVEVPGDIREQIQIESVKAQRSEKTGSFFIKAPNQAAVAVRNLGNGFARPFGKVTLDGTIGGQVYTYDINNTDPRGIVLPDSARTFTDNIKGVKWPGKYTLTASVAYGDGGEVVSFKSSFIYMPLWAIIALLVILAALGVGSYIFYRRRYGKKRSK